MQVAPFAKYVQFSLRLRHIEVQNKNWHNVSNLFDKNENLQKTLFQDFWRHLVHGAMHSWLHGEVAVEKRDASEDVTAREEVSFVFQPLQKAFQLIKLDNCLR